ncbi:MAG: electron transfer flavoprotein subunit beta/FixA family protein [Victivallaceae bacterium]|nr:electron transfer flavoprotein subunit beta/FixA family protein [Victivallaceae bacterium]
MKIAVCIKQVPGTAQVEIDPETGTLKRDGASTKMNPFDLYAIETAMRIKEAAGAELTAVTMGPPQAEAVLREAFMMGADRAVLLSDRRFGGADVLATGYTLSQGLRAAGNFDLIVCGRQTTDGDTAQVGAELAEFLGIPHVTNVCAICEIAQDAIVADIDWPLQTARCRLPFPCLITVDKNIFEPRLPSFKLKLATAGQPITRIGMDDLPDKNEKHYGLSGSPTRVKRIFPPEAKGERIVWSGNDAPADKLHQLLTAHKFLQQL